MASIKIDPIIYADIDADTHKVKKFIGRVLTGEKFIEEFPNLSKRLVKLTNEKEEKMENIIIKTGLNEDVGCYLFEGDPRRPEGITFIDVRNIFSNLTSWNILLKYIRKVYLPPDCKVLVIENGFIADKIELGEAEEIKDLDIWDDEELCIHAIKNAYNVTSYIRNFSERVQLAMVERNSSSIEIIIDKCVDVSEKIKLAAVKSCGYSIIYIKDPSEELQLEAVKNRGLVLETLSCMTNSEKIILEAINQNGLAYKYIKDRDNSEEIKLAAVKENGEAIQFITNPSQEIKLEAVRQTYKAIKYIKEPNTILQIEAFKQNAMETMDLLNKKNIRNLSEEVQKAAVSQNGNIIIFFDDASEEVKKAAVSQDGLSIEWIKHPSKEVQIEAVKQNGKALLKIRVDSKNISDEVVLEAVKQNPEMYKLMMRRPPKCVMQYMEQLLAKK